jgi:hypothetical protein
MLLFLIQFFFVWHTSLQKASLMTRESAEQDIPVFSIFISADQHRKSKPTELPIR